MIDLPEERLGMHESQSVKRQARALLEKAMRGSAEMCLFDDGFEHLPRIGEDPGNYLSRVLAAIGDKKDVYYKDPKQNQGIEVNIHNRVLRNVASWQQGVVAAVTYREGGKIVGYGLTVERPNASASVLFDTRGYELPEQLEHPLGLHDAINRAQQLFLGRQIDEVRAIAVGMLPREVQGGGHLHSYHRPRLRTIVA